MSINQVQKKKGPWVTLALCIAQESAQQRQALGSLSVEGWGREREGL